MRDGSTSPGDGNTTPGGCDAGARLTYSRDRVWLWLVVGTGLVLVVGTLAVAGSVARFALGMHSPPPPALAAWAVGIPILGLGAGVLALGQGLRARKLCRNGAVVVADQCLVIGDHRGKEQRIRWDTVDGVLVLKWRGYAGAGPELRLRLSDGRSVAVEWGLVGWQDLLAALHERSHLVAVRRLPWRVEYARAPQPGELGDNRG